MLTFLVKKRYNETFRGVDFLRLWEKTLNHLFLVVVVLEIPQNPRVDIFLRQEKALKDSKRRLFFCSMKCLHYCLFNLSRRDRVVKSAFLTWKFCREIQFFFMPNENESKCRINCDRFCRVWRFCSTKFKLLYQIDSGADLLPYLIFISHDRFGTWLERRLNRAFNCWASQIYHVNESQQPLKVSCQGYTWPFGYTRTRTFFIAYSFIY